MVGTRGFPDADQPMHDHAADVDEQTLLERLRAGDSAALGVLLKRHERRLYNLALRMVSNRDDAAEVTQEAFLKIVQHIDRYRGEAQITTWMTRITMNQAISHLRKRRIRTMTSIEGNGRDDGYGGGGHDGPALTLRGSLADEKEPGPDLRVQQDEQRDRVREAIARLDDDFRAVLVLRDIDGLDYAAIANTLELKVGTVKSRLFRARLALRQAIQEMEACEGDATVRGRNEGFGLEV